MIFSIPGRYDNFSKFLDIRHYQWDKLMSRFGFDTYTAKDGQYIEDVAWEVYRDASNWWILSAVNNLNIGVLDKMSAGQKLKIPKQQMLDVINAPLQRRT